MLQSSKICNFLLIFDGKKFCEEILQKIGSEETFLDSFFSDKAKSHLDGIMNRHIPVQFKVANHLKKIIRHLRDMPKVATVT
jgi:hypothetical protein